MSTKCHVIPTFIVTNNCDIAVAEEVRETKMSLTGAARPPPLPPRNSGLPSLHSNRQPVSASTTTSRALNPPPPPHRQTSLPTADLTRGECPQSVYVVPTHRNASLPKTDLTWGGCPQSVYVVPTHRNVSLPQTDLT